MITIINYGSGNIHAIANIYYQLKVPYKIAARPADVLGARKIFLPGVGAFDETISKLDEIGFREVLDQEVLVNNVPIIGICVGMQILAESSEEGTLKGLGYIKGHVKKLDESLFSMKPKLPHLGWNSIEIKQDSRLLEGVDTSTGFYYLHSYHLVCEENENVIATSEYGISVAAVVGSKNIFGVQFHPEKSHYNGVKLLKNFAEL